MQVPPEVERAWGRILQVRILLQELVVLDRLDLLDLREKTEKMAKMGFVDGKPGKDGVDGKVGLTGKDGVDGKDGKNGVLLMENRGKTELMERWDHRGLLPM
jgi:hypothetical protein